MLLFQFLTCVVLAAFNFYGTSQLYAAEQPRQKAGRLLGWAAPALLLHLFLAWARPQWPPVLVFSLFLLGQAALFSAVLRGQGPWFRGLHRHQRAAHPVAWPAMVRAVEWFSSRLAPILVTCLQAWLIFS